MRDQRLQVPTGYDGTLCEKEAREKFLGSWVAIDHITGTVDNISYATSIVTGTTLTEVKIINIYGQFNNPVIATVDGIKINIALQSPDSPNKTMQGVGTYDASANSINWIYAITYTGGTPVTFEGAWQGD